jgi:hypothetical protein
MQSRQQNIHQQHLYKDLVQFQRDHKLPLNKVLIKLLEVSQLRVQHKLALL